MKTDRADIVVYTLGWGDGDAVDEDQQPEAQVHSRVVVNGREIGAIRRTRVDARGNGEFSEVKLWLCPSTVRFVSLSESEWNAGDLSHRPSPEVMRELLVDGIEAFRITREYVGAELMKDEPGWQWAE